MSEVKWEYSRVGDIPKYTWDKFTVEWEEFSVGGQWNVSHDGNLVMSSAKNIEQVLNDCEAFAKRIA